VARHEYAQAPATSRTLAVRWARRLAAKDLGNRLKSPGIAVKGGVFGISEGDVPGLRRVPPTRLTSKYAPAPNPPPPWQQRGCP